MSSLAERLQQVQHDLFVGRGPERADLGAWMDDAGSPFNVLYLSGPGGIGKSTLLREFAWQASARGLAVQALDGTLLDPTPDSFRLAVGSAATLLLVDGYEALQPLDRWLVEHFLPTRAARSLLVLAGRQPPSSVWRLNTAVWQLVRHRALDNFSEAESHEYLERRHVPDAQRTHILSFTHGHPLATAMAADAALLRGGFAPLPDPDMLKTLLEHFVEDIPTERHRQALEAAAVVHRTTQGLLQALIDVSPVRPGERAESQETGTDAHELFAWLRSLSFVEARADGLVPHDVVREVLIGDLRWRHPERLVDIHRRARQWYHQRLASRSSPGDVFDLVYLHRDNPMIRPFLDWKKAPDFLVERYRASDEPALVDMARRHEGETAVQHLAHWLQRVPEGVRVVHDSQGEVKGFSLHLPLHRLPFSEADPQVAQVQRFLAEHGPLRPGEAGWYCRFWMCRNAHQGVSAVQSRIFLTFVVEALSTPNLAFQAITVAQPMFWAPAFAYAAAHRLEDTATWYYDWRTQPPYLWLELLAEHEMDPQAVARSSPAAAAAVLSQDQFGAAVKEALKAVANAEALVGNPLGRCRFVLQQCASGAGDLERAHALQAGLRQALETLQSRPRDAKLYRALRATYFEPAATQEVAAQQLDLPFSTYRRHLTAGIARLQEMLWQRELRR